jgi:hypothetical protein
MPVHDDDLARSERTRGLEHMGKQRPARQAVQHLRQRGMHALALPGGKDDDVDSHVSP